MSLVEGQLAAFAGNMERDSAAQRAECGAAVGAAAARGGAFIEDTLQLGNTEALTTYVFGSKRSQGSLPAAAGGASAQTAPSSSPTPHTPPPTPTTHAAPYTTHFTP